ncbi:hypothetical protein C8Q77DRAFT_665876 [Trametes polyzona]|nr:hypothetical protein C8Q77DRAFT_665876 [Trametes polyzona]
MPPRRHRSASTAQGQTNAQNAPSPAQRAQTPASEAQRQLGIYQSNMKVLLRREPSITAIIDQFSHVCLYHYNGQKWEKHGYEGSMFLFEKSTYPTYGFYILNRMGTDDYVRPIYPEDDMEIIGEYLMCRFYPDFTKTRLDMGLPYPIPPEHRAAFDHELSRRAPSDEQTQNKEKKGRSITLGLWMFATDAREPLKQVMMRLHSYVKQGLPYPDEFKYGPGRPPPPNPHLRTTSRASAQTPSQDQGNSSRTSQPNGKSHTPAPRAVEQRPPTSSGTSAELDKLFAKLIPPSVSAPLPSAPSSGGPATAKSVHDLFANLTGQGSADASRGVQPLQPPAPQQPAPAAIPEPPPSRGLALLDSIFASVTPAASSTSLHNDVTPVQPSRPEEVNIVSPKPTSSALPQILNQDVISKLLGLGPDSRASSAAPSSVGSRHSNQRRYEGDNEYSEGDPVSDGVPSRSHTTDVEANSRSAGIPTFSVQNTGSSESDDDPTSRPTSSRRVPGDVTPRPPAGGLRLPPTSPPEFQQQTTSVSAPHLSSASKGTPGPDTPSGPRERQLVPFEANSDLWPYPRAPLDDRSFENDDVVELDFSDTRALSDPVIFTSRLKEKQKKKGRKSKKEREEDKAREQAEIEKGWDMPAQGHGQQPYPATAKTAAAALAPNGASTGPAAVNGAPKEVKKAAANGANSAPVVNGHGQNGVLDSNAAKDAVLAAMSSKAVPAIGKKEFITELLTLIHTDSKFAESLWHDYLSRAA